MEKLVNEYLDSTVGGNPTLSVNGIVVGSRKDVWVKRLSLW